jgi:predicted transcriptional regulator
MLQSPADSPVTHRDSDLVERFLAAHSAVEQALRKATGRRQETGLVALIVQYTRDHRGWKDADALRELSELRNVIVHNRTEPYEYLSIPTERTVERIEAIRDGLLHAPLAIPTFQREVATAHLSDPLSRVLEIIRGSNFSQLPVYEERRFAALLTANGITRWLAHHSSTKCTAVDFEDVSVADVVAEQESRQNWAFLARDARVDSVIERFASNPLLEAVLITQRGKDSEALLGIATRWDVPAHL